MKKIIKYIFLLKYIFIFITPANSSDLNIDLNFVKTHSIHICNVLIGKSKLNDQWSKKGSGFKKLLHKNKTYLVSSRIFQRAA